MVTFLSKFRRDEKGETLVEHGIALILALVVGGVGLTLLGGGINTQLGQAATCISTQGGTC